VYFFISLPFPLAWPNKTKHSSSAGANNELFYICSMKKNTLAAFVDSNDSRLLQSHDARHRNFKSTFLHEYPEKKITSCGWRPTSMRLSIQKKYELCDVDSG
jgi:hypothetical protein